MRYATHEHPHVRAELEARVRQQAAVADLSQLALSGIDVPALLDAAVSCVAQTLEVELCKVLELLPDGDALLLRAGVGWTDGAVACATCHLPQQGFQDGLPLGQGVGKMNRRTMPIAGTAYRSGARCWRQAFNVETRQMVLAFERTIRIDRPISLRS